MRLNDCNMSDVGLLGIWIAKNNVGFVGADSEPRWCYSGHTIDVKEVKDDKIYIEAGPFDFSWQDKSFLDDFEPHAWL